MKKIALFALLALFVSVAQAVTINWQMDIRGTDAKGNTKPGGYAGIVVLAGHMTSVPAYEDAFEVHNKTVQADDGTNVLVKGLDNVLGVVDANAAKTSSDSSRAGLLTANQWGFYVGGYAELPATVYGTFDLTNATDGFTVVLINQYGKAYTAQHYDVSGEGTVTMDLGALNWKYGETNVLPEPTALALLALGVAGLALRRRA